MESKKLDIGQVYGYAVCLMAILTFLYSSAKLANAVLDLRELPYTQPYVHGPSLVSLEAYRIDLLSRLQTEKASAAALAAIPADATWRSMFEQERLHRLALSHQTSRTTAVCYAFTSGLAVLLFAFHWRWLQTRERRASDGPGASPPDSVGNQRGK